MARVLGVGDNVVDKYIHHRMMYPGGNALNFAAYAKQLGADSSYMGVFGSDRAAQHIKSVLRTLGVDVSRCRSVDGENGYAEVNLVNGDRVFVTSNKGGVLKSNPLVLNNADLAYIRSFDLVHSSCHSYFDEEIRKVHALGVPISFDFSNRWTPEYLQRVCPYVTFSFLSCGHVAENQIVELLHTVHRCGSKIAVATLGSKGAMLFDGHRLYSQQSHLVEALDTMGAGDSFLTAFLLNYISAHQDDPPSGGELHPVAVGGDEEIISTSLAQAAFFASKTCMVSGAFGYGVEY